MARRTSEAVKIIQQAQISVASTDIVRKDNFAEKLVAVSDKHGCIIVAKGNECLVVSLAKLEGSFKGGEEQSLEEGSIVCRRQFKSHINYLALSQDSEYIAVHVGDSVLIHHVSALQNQVRYLDRCYISGLLIITPLLCSASIDRPGAHHCR